MAANQEFVPLKELNEDEQHELKPFEDSETVIVVLKDDYESLPLCMKNLASWEELVAAVEKMNLYLKLKAKNKNIFTEDDVSYMELGPKIRSYILLLVKMKIMVFKNIDGLISYRLL